MKNWKTTLFGCLLAVSGALQHYGSGTIAQIGSIGSVVFAALLGSAAGDSSNSK